MESANVNHTTAPSQDFLEDQLLERVQSRLQQAFSRVPLDLDYLEFLCKNELILIESFADQTNIPPVIIDTLRQLSLLVKAKIEENPSTSMELMAVVGARGRSKFSISVELLKTMLDTCLPVSCIAELLGVSQSTIFRRMQEYGLSVSELYSNVSDEELDNMITTIKTQMPNAGYRMVKGLLMSMGCRIQWRRMKASMHRVDSAGILSRMAKLGCVVRRSYCVRGPLALVHVDTNHKLIRYNMVIFGGIDGYSRKLLYMQFLMCPALSRKSSPLVLSQNVFDLVTLRTTQLAGFILYLDAATDNKASTAFKFFLESTRVNGVPSRVRGDQGVENVDIANFMFSARGTGRASFISGRSVHNQRVERLWRDVWIAVSSIQYDVLNTLEEDGLLDITNPFDLFCVHFVFLPRLQAALRTFAAGWNSHPLSSEGNRSPEQLWQMGHLLNLAEDNLEDFEEPGIDWEGAVLDVEDSSAGVVVPQVDCPLSQSEMTTLQSIVNPLSPSDSYGRDLYVQALQQLQQSYL